MFTICWADNMRSYSVDARDDITAGVVARALQEKGYQGVWICDPRGNELKGWQLPNKT